MATAQMPPPALVYNLVLIGGRGCGKSSIARRLQRKDKRFKLLSLDTLIRYEAGGSEIPEIVERRGWHGFRDIEYDVVTKAGAFAGSALLDCGGGVVVDLDEQGGEVFSERKVEALYRHGRVVYLHRETPYLKARIAGDANRPDLSAVDSFDAIMARRDPWYREAAHHVMECGRLGKAEITNRVLSWFYDACRDAGRDSA